MHANVNAQMLMLTPCTLLNLKQVQSVPWDGHNLPQAPALVIGLSDEVIEKACKSGKSGLRDQSRDANRRERRDRAGQLSWADK